MKISNDDINKFKSIYKKYYGIDLDNKTALEYANSLIVLTNILITNNK